MKQSRRKEFVNEQGRLSVHFLTFGVVIAGAVIARQRPGTASGFIFISGEDETGISNAIIHPKVYERNQMAVTSGKFLTNRGSAPKPG